MSKTTLLVLFILLEVLVQNQGAIKRWLFPLPPISATTKIVLYSTEWCSYCAKTRDFFTANNIVYQEIDVEQTHAGQNAYQQLGANGVPIIVINNTIVIKGYAPDQIDEALRHQ